MRFKGNSALWVWHQIISKAAEASQGWFVTQGGNMAGAGSWQDMNDGPRVNRNSDYVFDI